MRTENPKGYFLLSIFLLAFSLASARLATAAGQTVISSTQTELQQQQKKMKRLQRGIEQQQSLFSSSQKKETRLLDELTAISTKLNTEKTRLQALEQQLSVQQTRLDLQQEKLAELTAAKKKLQQHVEKRLAAYYRLGRIGYLNAIFSNSGLSSLLHFEQAFQLMTQRDRQAASLYRTKIKESEETTNRLREQKEILTALVAEVRSQEQQYSHSKEQRETLLKRVVTEKQLYGAALKEIEAAADSLTERLTQLRKEEVANSRDNEVTPDAGQQKGKAPFSGLSFAAQKGKLSPPVEGTVTQKFGKSATKKFGLTLQTNGITIDAPPGSAIKAVYYGRVVYVGELKGYGNIIILDHDQQYYSLVARAEKYFKHKGDRVMAGEVIGVVGDETGLLEKGIHFEIRRGTKPLDPLAWLRPGSLKLAPGS